MDKQKRFKKNIWMFPLGTVGRDVIYSLFTNFIYTFVLYTRTLNAAQLLAITGIMIGARVFDALNDPIMGNIIDRTRTRWGKFKPWLAIGIVTTSLVVYFAFNTTLQGWSFIIFFGVIYFLYSITYTMHDISYWGMVPALSSDANARNEYTSRATLFAGVGGTAASILIPLFTAGSTTIGGNAAYAYGRVALAAAIIAPLFLCFTIFGAQEKRDYEKEPAPPISFRKIWSTITGNKQLMWVSLVFLIHEVGNSLLLGGTGSTYIYFEFGYQGGKFSLFSTVGMAATAFLMLFYPAISRRIHRKKLLGQMAVVAVIGYAVMIGSGLLLSTSDAKFWLLTIGYMIANFGQYCYYLVLMISIINTVEYNEYEHGTRDEAIIASLRPFLTKLSSALVVLLTTLTYLAFRVTDSTNKIAELEQKVSLGVMTEETKITEIAKVISTIHPWQNVGLLLTMTVLPCMLMLISYFIYRDKYILDEETYDRICAELEQRKRNAK